jgi:hypothetical protein
MVGTGRPGKGQNMEFNEKWKLVQNVYKYKNTYIEIKYFWTKLGAS